MNKKVALATLTLVFLIAVANVNAARTPTTTTIPTVTATSAGVVQQCSPLIAFPGSIITGANGFVLITCPSPANGAVLLDGTLTPTFTLTTGYVQAAVIISSGVAGTGCNFNFRTITVGNVTVPTGRILNSTITFASSPVAGNMLSSVYDYCLQYQSASVTGLAGFTITWS